MKSNKKQGRYVLIVEDSLTQAEKLKYFLDKNNYNALIAENGKKALNMVSKRSPSLVITDIIMPGMNGYELCRIIKDDDSLKNIPVVLLSILSDPADILKGLECGADNFITKPYDEKFLLKKIHQLLSTRPKTGEDNDRTGKEILYGDSSYYIKAPHSQILDFLISTYETAIIKNEELEKAHKELRDLNDELEKRVHDRTQELAVKNEELRKDIIERKEAELKYRTIFENAVEGIFRTDLNGCILSANPAFARLLGYDSPQEFMERIGDMRSIYVDPNKRNELIDLIRKNGTVIDFEVKYRCKNKKEIFCSVSAHGTLDPGGKLTGFEGMVLDITERKGVEDELIEANRVLETIFEQTNILFAYLDADLNFVRVNRSFAQRDNHEPSFFHGKNYFELYPDPDIERIFQSAIKSGEPHSEICRKFEYPDHSEHGTSYWDMSIVPIKDVNGTVNGLILALQNVTKRLQTEKELHNLNAELDSRVKERTSEIEKKNAELERFNKMFIGRELRMIELKNDIVRLEEKLKAMRKSEGVK